MKLYPIGDVARRTGLSVSAIRFYADAGIIAPTGLTDGGHRLYDIEAVAQLELVRTLRELGAGLEEIRKLLADEMTLHDLATAHLELLERQTRSLQARRAVLRTIVRSHRPSDQVSLMHRLVTMSDDDRERLLDDFWREVTDGLDVHPTFAERLRRSRPDLPDEPTPGQLEAWIELADLVRDGDFRRAVHAHLTKVYTTTEHGRAMSSPAMMEQIEKRAALMKQAEAAHRAGLAVDSPQARELADRYVAMGGRPDTPEERRRVAGILRATVELARKGVETARDSVFGRYQMLVGTINGTLPDPSAWDYRYYAWMGDALDASAAS